MATVEETACACCVKQVILTRSWKGNHGVSLGGPVSLDLMPNISKGAFKHIWGPSLFGCATPFLPSLNLLKSEATPQISFVLNSTHARSLGWRFALSGVPACIFQTRVEAIFTILSNLFDADIVHSNRENVSELDQ